MDFACTTFAKTNSTEAVSDAKTVEHDEAEKSEAGKVANDDQSEERLHQHDDYQEAGEPMDEGSHHEYLCGYCAEHEAKWRRVLTDNEVVGNKPYTTAILIHHSNTRSGH